MSRSAITRADVETPIRAWRRTLVLLAVRAVANTLLGHPVSADNSVRVGSARVGLGGTTVIGVYLTNDETLGAFVLPLVVRSESGGAFMTAWTPAFNLVPASRMTNYLKDSRTLLQYPVEDGDCKNGYAGGFRNFDSADFISPDGLFFGAVSMLTSTELPPGTDGAVPSLLITLSVNYQAGVFDIDTTCTDPANHVMFGRPGGVGPEIKPSFTKGVITVGSPDLAYWPRCSCPNPVSGTDVITSPFGPRHPTDRPYDYHPAIDIDFITGESEHAITGGLVEDVEFIDGNYGWFTSIRSYGFDQDSKPASYTARYLHMNQLSVVPGQVITRQNIIGTCGNWPKAPSHLHLETWPDCDPNERAHPVRYLNKPETNCPEIDSTWSLGGDTAGAFDYLLCTSLSPKSDKYDLSSIDIYVYAESCRVATIDFETFDQMKSETSVFTFFSGTAFEVTVTLTPDSLVTTEPFHKIGIKVDPAAPLPTLEWVGISLWDVSSTKPTFGALGKAEVRYGSLCDLGNVSGDTPGRAVQVFSGRRVDSTVELWWLGSSQVSAEGVRISRSRNGSPEEIIHEGLLPYRSGSSGDTVVYVDRDAGAGDDLIYRLSVVLRNGMCLATNQVVRIPSAVAQSPMPVDFDLGQNFPNPFNASTQIPFSIDAASTGPVKIQLFDILGRRVATVFSSDNVAPGRYACEWDCRDSYGQPVASGIYFYRLDTKDRHVSRKMVLLK